MSIKLLISNKQNRCLQSNVKTCSNKSKNILKMVILSLCLSLIIITCIPAQSVLAVAPSTPDTSMQESVAESYILNTPSTTIKQYDIDDFHVGEADKPDYSINNDPAASEVGNRKPSCKWYQLGCWISSIFSTFWNKIWIGVAKGCGKFIGGIFSFWMKMPLTGPMTMNIRSFNNETQYDPMSTVVTLPDPTGRNHNGVSVTIADMLGWIKWIAAIAAILMLIIYFGKLSIARGQGEGFKESKSLLWIGLGLFITSGGIALVSVIFSMQGSASWRGPIGWVTSQLWPITIISLIVSLFVTAIKVIVEQNGKPIKELVSVFLTVIIISNLGGGIVLLLSAMSDQLSLNIISNSIACGNGMDSCMGSAVEELLADGVETLTLSWILILLICLIGLISSITQFCIMIGRSIMVIFVLGGLTFTASFRYIKLGKEAFEKQIGWLFALIIYKPVVAIIYGVSFKFLGQTDNKNLGNSLVALFYFFVATILAIFALPALMKLVTPTVAAMADSSGSSVGQAISSVAQGALMAGRMAAGDPTAAADAAGKKGAGGSGGVNAAQLFGADGGGGAPPDGGGGAPPDGGGGAPPDGGGADAGVDGNAAGAVQQVVGGGGGADAGVDGDAAGAVQQVVGGGGG